MVSRSPFRSLGAAAFAAAALVHAPFLQPSSARAEPLPRAEGFRGIWYANQPSKDEWRYKYSGGLATYPQQHVPIAVRAPDARRTYFVYGAASAGAPGKASLLHAISFYDHDTGTVARPRILLDKKTDDAHDNPVLALGGDGRLFVFSNSHGTARPSCVHRSLRPHDIDEFELVLETNFSYGQPWRTPDRGFVFLHTRYARGRGLHWATSPDGIEWSEPKPLAMFGQGHYQISRMAVHGEAAGRVATAFDFHPDPGGLNARTNLYYLQTDDAGATWTGADGARVEVPADSDDAPALLVHDYRSEGLLVYLKDMQLDSRGRPVILYLTSRGHASGPAGDPRQWRTARLGDAGWEIRDFALSDHNYDHGSLFLDDDTHWRVLAPTDPGPQSYNPGGEVVLWRTRDAGATWDRVRDVTRDSPRNHTYVRGVAGDTPETAARFADFAAIWADGDTREPSESFLYLCDRDGENPRRLPATMEGDFAAPEPVADRAEAVESQPQPAGGSRD